MKRRTSNMGYYDPSYKKPKYGYGVARNKSRYGVDIKLSNSNHFHADFTEPPTKEMIDKAREEMEEIINGLKESK